MKKGMTGDSIVSWILWAVFLALILGTAYYLRKRFGG
ncbi:hypothetical protein COU60_04675 [Candidatus Pacearchaeota archaeon CG10_big_fil_rev_8_21_14_0_10_34_76]|nr:MAG: hypothetical protein COU60_04675 [Candidatus Pacearchaeota archaeon CG10_big_fil_rev_8_21_14_0_10_34_76]